MKVCTAIFGSRLRSLGSNDTLAVVMPLLAKIASSVGAARLQNEAGTKYFFETRMFPPTKNAPKFLTLPQKESGKKVTKKVTKATEKVTEK